MTSRISRAAEAETIESIPLWWCKPCGRRVQHPGYNVICKVCRKRMQQVKLWGEGSRYYSGHEELDAWIKAHDLTEEQVLDWLRGPSLWTYVTKRLQGLLHRKERAA